MEFIENLAKQVYSGVATAGEYVADTYNSAVDFCLDLVVQVQVGLERLLHPGLLVELHKILCLDQEL